jgi:hypothetical protein
VDLYYTPVNVGSMVGLSDATTDEVWTHSRPEIFYKRIYDALRLSLRPGKPVKIIL